MYWFLEQESIHSSHRSFDTMVIGMLKKNGDQSSCSSAAHLHGRTFHPRHVSEPIQHRHRDGNGYEESAREGFQVFPSKSGRLSHVLERQRHLRQLLKMTPRHSTARFHKRLHLAIVRTKCSHFRRLLQSDYFNHVASQSWWSGVRI